MRRAFAVENLHQVRVNRVRSLEISSRLKRLPLMAKG